MRFETENENHSINKVRKEGGQGNYKIAWDAKGFINQGFIIINASDINSVLLVKDEIREKLNDCENQLFSKNSASVDSINFYYLSFKDMFSNSGFKIEDNPGYYAIYGCTLIDEKIDTVYYAQRNDNILNISVEIEIEQKNYNVSKKKGLFKTVSEYSGYKKVTINRPIKNIKQGAVSYEVKGINMPLPIQVLENGGSFYVWCEENDELKFHSNNTAITISSV